MRGPQETGTCWGGRDQGTRRQRVEEIKWPGKGEKKKKEKHMERVLQPTKSGGLYRSKQEFMAKKKKKKWSLSRQNSPHRPGEKPQEKGRKSLPKREKTKKVTKEWHPLVKLRGKSIKTRDRKERSQGGKPTSQKKQGAITCPQIKLCPNGTTRWTRRGTGRATTKYSLPTRQTVQKKREG